MTGTPRQGRELVEGALTRIVSALALVEDADARLPLVGAAGPFEGRRFGEMRVLTGSGVRLVHGVLADDEFGMDTHQVYAFTGPSSAVPHLFLDAAISPNTEGTFHVGLDLAPRVDLGASLDHTEAVYAPLTAARAAVLEQDFAHPVPSLGPLQWSLRSPWMVAAIVDAEHVPMLQPVVDTYVQHWLELLQSGVPTDVDPGALASRDQRNRDALFNPRTNPVWGLIGKLLGPDTAARMTSLLTGSPA